MARRTDIRLLNDMEKARRFAKKPHCVDFSVFDGLVAPLEELVEAAVAEKQQQQKALMKIEMRQLNYSFTKPFANGWCVLEYSKLPMFKIFLLLL